MRFARLDLIYVLAGIAILMVLLQWKKRKPYFAHSFAGHSYLEQMKSSALRLLPKIFVIAGIVAAGGALLEPRAVFRESIHRLEGLDIVMVMDLSSSMQEALGGYLEQRKLYEAAMRARARAGGAMRLTDLPPPETRMQAVQRALLEFVSLRKKDRLALVVFSENTYIVSPLTIDHAYLEKYIRMIDANILLGEGMTAIGDGIAAAIDLLQREKEADTKNKVIVVFTDGEHNYGRDPIEVLADARFYGYRIYMIGVDLGEITRKENVQMLIRSIKDSGGEYYDARNKSELARAYSEIDRIEKGVFVQKTLETDVPAYETFLIVSLSCLFVGIVLNTVPYFIEIT
ncbi:MAG: VWA domain-containing protein [Acidobacteria bacterium]|nr:VWA domain-containing protein [Acidobacteriota bacterium]